MLMEFPVSESALTTPFKDLEKSGSLDRFSHKRTKVQSGAVDFRYSFWKSDEIKNHFD